MATLSRDEAEQQNQLEVLRAAAEGRAEQPLYFCWFEAAATWAGQQFAARLGLDGGQAPALVAVAPKKERSAVMTGRFEKVRWKARQAMSADAPPLCYARMCLCPPTKHSLPYVCLPCRTLLQAGWTAYCQARSAPRPCSSCQNFRQQIQAMQALAWRQMRHRSRRSLI